MINQVFDNFDRTEFSDEIYSIYGRALTVAARFDSNCKALARLPLFKASLIAKYALNEEQYSEMVKKVNSKYKNLNRAIESLKFDDDLEVILSNAREARNELIHETPLGSENGFDLHNTLVLNEHLTDIQNLVLTIIKGDALVSAILSTYNKEPISNSPFSESYENKYVNWVMEREEI